MGRVNNNSKNLIKNLLILSGKPLFSLLTFLSISLFTLILLSKKIIQSIKLPHLPKFSKPQLPSPPKLLPKIDISYRLIIITLITFIFSRNFYTQIIKDLPTPYDLLNHHPSQSTKILDRNGLLLYQIYKDENRTLIKLPDLPKHLIDATISAEDKNFYSHYGVSLTGITRALKNNLTNQTLHGGSTITQQLIKNTLLNNEKTLQRKTKELILAIWTEQVFTKDEILEMYLNQVSYGGTAYGIEEASKQYFNKNAKDLTLSESALLAGLPASPTTFSPLGTNPYLAKQRQQEVLREMFENGYLNQQELDEASNEPLTLKSDNITMLAPHFVTYTIDYLASKYDEPTLTQEGLVVTTTLDYELQTMLQKTIIEELDKIKHLNVKNAAGLIVDPKTGEILAMVGSRNFFDFENDGQVNVTTMKRQPGSAIKPITYTLAFQNGLTPSSQIEDTPIAFTQPGQEPYRPKNYDGKFHGKISLRTALASSYNVPATKLLNHLGIDNFIDLAQSMGIKTWEDRSRYGLAITLGGAEITMLDLTQVYQNFANYGNKVEIHPILKVTTNNQITLENNTCTLDCPSTPTISPLVAYQINDILSDNQARSPAFGSNSVLNIKNHQVAVKTGTTNNLRDNWTFGYTSDYLVSIWVGNNDNTPMNRVASGITGASPIWAKVINNLLKDQPTHAFERPLDMIKVTICKETNTLYCKGCPSSPYDQYYIKGTEPKSTCNFQNGTILKDAVSVSATQ